MQRTLCGIELEVSQDAPEGKIVVHPNVMFELMNRAYKELTIVENLIPDDVALPRVWPGP